MFGLLKGDHMYDFDIFRFDPKQAGLSQRVAIMARVIFAKFKVGMKKKMPAAKRMVH